MSDMLFSFSLVRDRNAKQVFRIGKRFFNLFTTEHHLNKVNLSNGDIVFWIGDLYYISEPGAEPARIGFDNCNEKLIKLFDMVSFDPWQIKERLEGSYIIIHYQSQQESVFVYCDYLNRLSLFYTTQGDTVIASLYLPRSFIDKAGGDLDSKQFVDSYIAYLENMRRHHLFGLCHHFYTTASLVKQKVGEESVVFNGEGCDSLHNFGFSQYISIIYPDDDFAEYADKMKNYLYGPMFFKKIVENSYSEDFVYQLFKWHYGLNTINDDYPDLSERIFHYLYSFVFSHRRIPFAPDGYDFFNEVEYNGYYLPIIRTQLQQELGDVNSENIYSVLARLYCRYYLKGTNIMRVYFSIRDFGLRAALPYLDTGLLKFLERMPESWGKGLEMNHVKYPLKKFIEKRHHYPIDIVSKGPHSYISETDPGVNAYYEYICHSTLTEYFKEILSEPL